MPIGYQPGTLCQTEPLDGSAAKAADDSALSSSPDLGSLGSSGPITQPGKQARTEDPLERGLREVMEESERAGSAAPGGAPLSRTLETATGTLVYPMEVGGSGAASSSARTAAPQGSTLVQATVPDGASGARGRRGAEDLARPMDDAVPLGPLSGGDLARAPRAASGRAGSTPRRSPAHGPYDAGRRAAFGRFNEGYLRTVPTSPIPPLLSAPNGDALMDGGGPQASIADAGSAALGGAPLPIQAQRDAWVREAEAEVRNRDEHWTRQCELAAARATAEARKALEADFRSSMETSLRGVVGRAEAQLAAKDAEVREAAGRAGEAMPQLAAAEALLAEERRQRDVAPQGAARG